MEERNKVNIAFSTFLQNEKEKRGQTQEEFAEMLGYSDRTLRRWLAGEVSKVEDIEHALRVLDAGWDDVLLTES